MQCIVRRLPIALMLSVFSTPAVAQAATQATIAQLEQFLASKRVQKESDKDVALQLSSVTLLEQLTESTLARIESEAQLGPQTEEQLQLLAAESIFSAPPATEWIGGPTPDGDAQRRMLEAARLYVNHTLRQLPDFLATRTTLSLDNLGDAPMASPGQREAPLHFSREYRQEVTFRNGREMDASDLAGRGGATYDSISPAGLTTWGEFGPILTIVLSDSFQGSVTWSRWQRSESGTSVAVFAYSIPESASHYSIDFCCYQKSADDPSDAHFRAQPGYRGEIYLDPATGAIDRITLEADLGENDPVIASGIAVQYGYVDIAGKPYLCPVRGVAVSEVHNYQMESVVKLGTEKHVNIVRFTGYHKFGSTARVLAGGSGHGPR